MRWTDDRIDDLVERLDHRMLSLDQRMVLMHEDMRSMHAELRADIRSLNERMTHILLGLSIALIGVLGANLAL